MSTIVGKIGGVEHQAWITTAYLLATIVVMPIYGKFGDVLGRRNLFLVAIRPVHARVCGLRLGHRILGLCHLPRHPGHLGGFFVDHVTWEWAFYINFPIGITTFITGLPWSWQWCS